MEDGNSLNVSDEIFFAAQDVDIVSRAGNPGSIPYLSVGAGGLASIGHDLTLAGGEVRLTGGGTGDRGPAGPAGRGRAYTGDHRQRDRPCV
ncbi:MAG: hypothetical protein R3C45_17445 [Phycisphaerales bacterium]